MTNDKKVISFDLDGTIVNSNFADNVWLHGLPKYYALENNISEQKAQVLLMQEYEKMGSDNREWYDLRYWISKYNLAITPYELLKEYENTISVYEDVKDVIKTLSKDFDLIISSGAMKEFIEVELTKTNLKKYFTDTFSSTSDTQTVKKDPAFYLMIVHHLKRNPSDITHIGDNEQYDYISPKKAGLNAFYLQRNSSNNADYIVSSLFDFEKKIRSSY